MSKENNKFPVLHSYKRNPKDGMPDFVKWDALSEDQAQTNHGQTLTRLAERGGLSPSEMTANVKGKKWCEIGSISGTTIIETMKQIAI